MLFIFKTTLLFAISLGTGSVCTVVISTCSGSLGLGGPCASGGGPTDPALGPARVPGLGQGRVPKSKAVTSRQGALTGAAPAAMPPKQAGNLLQPRDSWA